jgi:flagellar biosynthesis protein FlhF
MSVPDLKPGATYKFTVRSTEEAVRTIREQLGENAKVLSVRQVGSSGLFSKPKLEVVAQIAETASDSDVGGVPSPRVPSAGSTGPGSARGPRAESGGSPDSSDPARREFDPPADPLSLTRSIPHATSRVYAASVIAAPADFSPSALQPFSLPSLLRRSGFSEAMIARLQATPALAGHEDRPLHQTLVEVGRALRHAGALRPARALPARTAFLGTPGSGRTTALCKWLARDVFAKGRSGRVVKAEFDRPNPAEGLAVFCEALGVSLEYHAPSSEIEASALQPFSLQPSSGDFLYADLPGISLRSPADNAAHTRFLDREEFTGRVLVLNAAYDHAMLRRCHAAGRDLGATHLVFTHLDEVEHWGKLWDFLLEGELTPLFLATGPSLTGDCEEEAVNAVLRRTLPGA